MSTVLHGMVLALGAGVAIGSAFWIAATLSAFLFRWKRRPASAPRFDVLPPVTLLKPVCGLEKNLRENLRTAAAQDYPDYQVVYSVQRPDDPALPMLRELEQELGTDRVTVAVESVSVGLNGKINNLAGALRHARHDVLVISDSDVRLAPDYLRTIVAPLADPAVGCVCTFFRATDAAAWYEKMELLTINADHQAMAVLAWVTNLTEFCFGASTALRRQTLDRIGGLEGLGDYLVEDNEMGRRISASGLRLVAVPYVVDTMVDLRGPAHWWQKMTYWDQNTRAALPLVFTAALLLRVIPLGLLFAALRGGDALGLGVLALGFVARITAAAVVMGVALRDREGLASLWLIPVKDVLSLWWYLRAFVQRTVVWRGVEMALTHDGRLRPARSDRSP